MRSGVSIAAVALHNGLNANMLTKRVIEADHRPPPKPAVATTQRAQEVERSPARLALST